MIKTKWYLMAVLFSSLAFDGCDKKPVTLAKKYNPYAHQYVTSETGNKNVKEKNTK